jgi:hypothetical protein
MCPCLSGVCTSGAGGLNAGRWVLCCIRIHHLLRGSMLWSGSQAQESLEVRDVQHVLAGLMLLCRGYGMGPSLAGVLRA